MVEEARKIQVELITFKGEDCLKFTFIGQFTVDDAEFGVSEWKDVFASAGDEKLL